MPTRQIGFTAFKTAVHLRLTTDILTSGYNHYGNFVPKDPDWPYTDFRGIIGSRSIMFTTRDTEAEDNVINIHQWSKKERGGGEKEVYTMQNDITQAITASALVIVGYNAPYLILDFTDVMLDDTDPGRIKTHGVLRFRQQMNP